MAENPQSVPQEIPQEAVAKFHALTPEQQQTAIGRMTPELKQKFLPAALEYKAMHAPDSAYQRPMPPTPQPTTGGRMLEGATGFVQRNAPAIGGAIGGVIGAGGGPVGAAIGATAGGVLGSAVKGGQSTGSGMAKEIAKEGATQGALELGGGLAMKGISRVADLLGVKDSLMRFALKRGADFARDLDPAAAMNQYALHAATTKQLYEKTGQKISQLTNAADQVIAQSPGSNSIRPYSIAKAVIAKYRQKALATASPEEYSAMSKMLDGLQAQYVKGPTEKLMTPAEANALKRQFGETIDWGKMPPQDKVQAAFKTESAARREIYDGLNDAIEQALGGNGSKWRSINHDLFNLLEAQGALRESGLRTAGESGKLIPSLLDAMRKPGPASTVANFPSSTPGQLAIPNAIRLGATAGNELLGPPQSQNPIPTTP